MFWLGASLSIFISECIVIYVAPLGLAAMLLSVTLVPYLLLRKNKVVYTEDKIFLNAQGEPLTDRLPKGFAIIAVTFILTGFIYIPLFLSMNFIITELLVFPLSIISLYFLYKNCPIAILFNKAAHNLGIFGHGRYRSSYDPYSGHTTLLQNYQQYYWFYRKY